MTRERLSKLSHSVAGKVVLISGGASGIGRAVAHVCADDGAKIAILDLGEDRIAKAVAEIVAAGTPKEDVVGLVCNVRDNERVKEAVEEVAAKFGRIDCVVCCAGIGAVNREYKADSPEKEFWENMDAVVDICQTGVWRVCKAALPHLPSPGGRIVNIASVAGIRGASLTAYHTAKAAVCGIGRTLASQLGPKGITANTICPGFVSTPLTATAVGEWEKPGGAIETKVPLKRVGEPEDIGQVVWFLLTEAGGYISGQDIVVDGGWTSQA
ncbi:short-chain dehydrogenase/reductase SDR [Hyaloraphidium curvatum]|nr:short-chain dehydrogenase/reductase SDR [Hyaloraphidium curvatum]